MAALITSNFTLPQEVAAGIWKKTQGTSTLATLSGQTPQKFGVSNVMTLTTVPKAEIVAESAEKSPVPTAYGNITVNPFKLQVTMRCSNEVQWADEDYQLGILNDMIDNAGIALGRALDIVGYHKLNPLTGTVASSVTSGIADTANSATVASGAYDAAIEAAEGLVIAGGYTPTGIAYDPVLHFGLLTQKKTTEERLFDPATVDAFDGMASATSDTVSAKQEAATATKIIGFVGQFDAFRWGVQRDIAAHMVEYGDPDGLGDLQRMNQIAIRAEIVYGIGIVDTNAFAKIVTA